MQRNADITQTIESSSSEYESETEFFEAHSNKTWTFYLRDLKTDPFYLGNFPQFHLAKKKRIRISVFSPATSSRTKIEEVKSWSFSPSFHTYNNTCKANLYSPKLKALKVLPGNISSCSP